MRRQSSLAVVVLAAVTLASCGAGASATSAAAGQEAAVCAAIPAMRVAFAVAERAATAASDGNDATQDATDAQGRADAAVQQVIAAVGPAASGRPTALVLAVFIGVRAQVGSLASLVLTAEAGDLTPDRVARYRANLEQMMGTLEAVATSGWQGAPAACPGLAPLPTALPTIPPSG